jgi:hypothetical protein
MVDFGAERRHRCVVFDTRLTLSETKAFGVQKAATIVPQLLITLHYT